MEILQLIPFFQNSKKKLLKEQNLNSRDIRVTVFGKLVYVMNCTEMGMVFIDLDLSDRNWWVSNHRKYVSIDDIQNLVDQFTGFLKIAFVHSVFSSIESSMRLFLMAIDPTACSNGTDNFKNIYSTLLKRLNLQQYEPLIDLWRLVRNSVHNNGIYYPRNLKDETIYYNGTTYKFEVGSPIDFVNWQLCLDLTKDMEKMIVEVVYSKKISSLNNVIDPFPV